MRKWSRAHSSWRGAVVARGAHLPVDSSVHVRLVFNETPLTLMHVDNVFAQTSSFATEPGQKCTSDPEDSFDPALPLHNHNPVVDLAASAPTQKCPKKVEQRYWRAVAASVSSSSSTTAGISVLPPTSTPPALATSPTTWRAHRQPDVPAPRGDPTTTPDQPAPTALVPVTSHCRLTPRPVRARRHPVTIARRPSHRPTPMTQTQSARAC